MSASTNENRDDEAQRLRRRVAELQQRLAAGMTDVELARELCERERQLVAFDIHDGLTQDLAGALMMLQSIQQSAALDSQVQTDLSKAINLVQASIGEARRIINGLQPPVLAEQGIAAAVAHLIDEFSLTSGVDVELIHDAQLGRFAPALELSVYRIIQESLNNVRQHSGSRRATVRIVQSNRALLITVSDLGAGFDPGQVLPECLGLRGIRERARLLGGKAEIASKVGGGTKVRVELPLLPLDGQESQADA